MAGNKEQKKYPINDEIRARELRVIDEDGVNLGVLGIGEALDKAFANNLDLVLMDGATNPPVARIMDYGKFRYQQQRNAREQRKKQGKTETKQIKFRVNIGEGDYRHKLARIVEFLSDGNKVRVTVMFRGREMSHRDNGRKILERVASDCIESASASTIREEGRDMHMELSPKKSG